jgi:hypothetical protein
MHSRMASAVSAGLLLLAACSDRPATLSTAPPEEAGDLPSAASPATASRRPDRLAFLFARALEDPDFRTFVKSQLDASPFPEHKVQLQTFLSAAGGRARRTLAARNGIGEAEVDREATAAIPLEIYFPVPAHRAAWIGDENVFVATALMDHETPVAFDLRGRRAELSAEAPPATPVLAMVPVETDFNAPPAGVKCAVDCGVTGGGSTVSAGPGLYMTKAHFDGDYEGWLKGAPEYEIHVLGQLGSTDSLSDYQCAGADAGGPYAFDQNDRDWSGSVLLFSQKQLDDYKAGHPGQSVRVFALEDDDTPCKIITNKDDLDAILRIADSVYSKQTGGRDTTTSSGKYYKAAKVLRNLFTLLASFLKTNDDLIGTAIEDAVVGSFYPGYNWIVKGKNNVTHGWLDLEMR